MVEKMLKEVGLVGVHVKLSTEWIASVHFPKYALQLDGKLHVVVVAKGNWTKRRKKK